MKVITALSTVIFCLFIVTSCQKETVPKPLLNPYYPYTYKPLSYSEWSTRNRSFQEINVYEGLSLNEYGFLEGEIKLNKSDSLTHDFIIGFLENVLDRYKIYLGISDQESVNIETDLRIHIPMMVGGSTSSIDSYFRAMEEFKKEDFWPEIKDYFVTKDMYLTQRLINGQSFNGPTIYFTFDGEKQIFRVEKNWFPEFFKPENEIYNLGDAQAIACRFVQKEIGKDLWENKHNFHFSKVFLVHYADENIEIRECWKIQIYELQGINFLYIDAQTGEVFGWCLECGYA